MIVEVKSVDWIALDDPVVRRCAESRTLKLKRTKVTANADVTAVDPQKCTITLNRLRGNLVTLIVRNPEQFRSCRWVTRSR